MRGLAWVLGITRDPDQVPCCSACTWAGRTFGGARSPSPPYALEDLLSQKPPCSLYLHYSTTAMRSKGAPGAGSTPQKSEAANRSPTPGRTSGMQAPGGSWRVLHGHVQFSDMYVTCFGPSECRRWLQKQNYPLFSVFVDPWWPRARGSQCVACLWLLLVAGG
jgi:hypothetical protein